MIFPHVSFQIVDIEDNILYEDKYAGEDEHINFLQTLLALEKSLLLMSHRFKKMEKMTEEVHERISKQNGKCSHCGFSLKWRRETDNEPPVR